MAGYMMMTLVLTVLKLVALIVLGWLIVTAVKRRYRREEWEQKTKRQRLLLWVVDIAAILILLN